MRNRQMLNAKPPNADVELWKANFETVKCRIINHQFQNMKPSKVKFEIVEGRM